MGGPWRKTVILLMFFSVAANSLLTSNSPIAKGITQKRVFRLLAIEQMFDSCYMRSAQLLIKELLQFPNWNNSTDDYVSYIRLLSMYDYTEVDDEVKPFWINRLPYVYLKDEIKNFLGNVSAGEIIILYYCGHSHIVLNPPPLHSEFLGISPDELRELANSTLSNSYLTLILDTCYSGHWLDFSPRSNTVVACRDSQFAWGWCGEYGFFTKGIIDGCKFADEIIDDGWLSFLEVFPFAKNYTESIEDDQNPQGFFGAAEGDLPLVQRDPTRPFPIWDCAVIDIGVFPQKIEAGHPLSIYVTVENQGLKKATFDLVLLANSTPIGSRRVQLFPEEIVPLTFTWTAIGLYGTCLLNLTAVASVSPGEQQIVDNTCSKCFELKLMLRFDLNIDGSVDIVDILIAAEAFGSNRQNSRWNEDADINQDDYVGIDDILLIAKEFGKSFSILP